MRKTSISRPIEPGETESAGLAHCRKGFRVQTVMRVGRVRTGYDEGLVHVRNISDDGAGLRIAMPVHRGQAIVLELSDGDALGGQVVWTADRECGFRFSKGMDCAALLSRLANDAAAGSGRALRLNASKPVVVRSEIGLRLCELADVSLRGMKLRHDGSLTRNMTVKITLPSGLERCGVVRWSHGMMAGVLLLVPFCTEELGSSRSL